MGNPNRRPPKANAIPLGGIAPKVTANSDSWGAAAQGTSSGWGGADAGWVAGTTSGGAGGWDDPAPDAPANTCWNDSAKTTDGWDEPAKADDKWDSSVKDAQLDGGRDNTSNVTTADASWGAVIQKNSGGWDELGTPMPNGQYSSVQVRNVTQHSSEETADRSSEWTNAENRIPETVTSEATTDDGWVSKRPSVSQWEVSNSGW